jgi:ABC-type branched-subunit amino acid transport system ATPase component
MLGLSNVTAAYDQVPVLNGLSLELKRGEVLALLGRNGVGKTTLLRTIMGLLTRSSGSIALDDTRLDGVPSHMIARLGVVLVPQGRGILPKLSVRENLVVGGRAAATRGPMPLHEILDRFPALKDRMNQLGCTLSGGNNSSSRLRAPCPPGPASCCWMSRQRAFSPTSCKIWHTRFSSSSAIHSFRFCLSNRTSILPCNSRRDAW